MFSSYCRDNADVLRAILEKANNPNGVNHLRHSALHMAIQKEAVSCIEVLLSQNADVNLKVCININTL